MDFLEACPVRPHVFTGLEILCHVPAHSAGGFLLHPDGGMGIGVQGEACGVVAQHGRYRFHVDAGLEGSCSKCVSQSMERDVLQTSVFQDSLVQVHHGVRMIHPASLGGGKQVLLVVFPSFLAIQNTSLGVNRIVSWCVQHLPHRWHSKLN